MLFGGISAAVRRFDANDDVTYETRAKLEKFWEEYLALDENRYWQKIFLLFCRETPAFGNVTLMVDRLIG